MSVVPRRRSTLALAALSAFAVTAINQAAGPGAALSGEFAANTTTLDAQSTAAVARAADGSFVLAWAGNGSGDTDGVFLRRYTHLGVAGGTEKRINTFTTGIQRNPALATAADGSFVVAWESQGEDGSGFGIYARRYDASGAAVGAPFAVNTFTTGDQLSPSVASSAGGAFVVAWQSLGQDGSGQGVFAQRYDAGGVVQGGEFQVNTYTSFSQASPDVAMDANGNFAIAWQSNNQEGIGFQNGIYAQRFSASGVPLGAELHLNTATIGNQSAPAIALDADGELIATWQGVDDGGTGIFAQRIDVTNAPVGSEFRVNDTVAADQRLPDVARDAKGNIVVSWQSPDADDSGIFLQRYDQSGAPVGVETPVNATTTGDQQRPAVAMDADGDVVVAWDSLSQDGSDLGVYARRFNGTEDVDLAIVKLDTVDPVSASAGLLSYTLTVSNLHPVASTTGVASVDQAIGSANGIVVTDTLPAGVSNATGTGTGWSCSGAGGVVTCSFANTLGAGASSQISLVAAAPAAPGEITNVATVAANQADAQTANNTSEQSTAVCAGIVHAGALQFSSGTSTVGEAGPSVSLTVTRAGGACGAATVHYATANGTAKAGTDFTSSTGTLTWADGDSAGKTIVVPITQDVLDESNENFTVTLSEPDRASLGLVTTATVTISDDDALPAVNFVPGADSPTEGDAGESTAVIVTAQLSAVSGRTVTVPFTVSGTATGGGKDHDAAAGSITIAAGSTSGSTTYHVVGDTLDEDDETILLTMGTPTNATAGSGNVHTATILDNDATPTVTFAAAASNAAEGSGTAQVAVQLSAPSGRAVSVDFSLGGTATIGGGNDYTSSASPLTIPAEASSASITLTVQDDALDEPGETVVLTLDSATGATLGETVQSTVTIVDNDTPPTVQFATATKTAAEASGTTNVALQLSSVSGKPVTVELVPGGNAQGGDVDYGVAPAPSVTIPAGETSATITYTVVNDALDEVNETATLSLGTITNGTAGAKPTFTITITDDDAAPVVSLASASQAIAENVDGGHAGIGVHLSAVSGRDVVVPFTLGGTAAKNADYTLPASPVTIPAGQADLTIPVTIVDDVTDEPNETIRLTIAAPADGSATLGSPSLHVLTINDNDALPGVSFSAASQTRNELDGTATITLTLTRPSSQDIDVDYTVGGTASEGDYTLPASPMTIVAGATSLDLPVTLSHDGIDETDETVVVTLVGATNANLRAPSTHTMTIVDNDPVPLVTLSIAGSPVPEGGAEVSTVSAQLSEAYPADVTVNLVFGGLAQPTDYTRSAESIVIPAGALIGSVTIAPVDDALDEFNEAITVDIGTVVNGTESGTQSVYAIITDDDPLPVVSWSPASVDVTEGNVNSRDVMAIVHLSAASGRKVTVPYTVGGTASAGSDHDAASHSFTIQPGATEHAVRFHVLGDRLDEPDETVELTIGTPTNATVGDGVFTANIVDDDLPPLVTLTAAETSIPEAGGSTTITGHLDRASAKQVTVNLTFGGNAAAGDYTRSAESIVIAAGALEGSITITGVDDLLDENDEGVRVDVGAVTDGTEDGTQFVRVVILDDDELPTVSFNPASKIMIEGDTGTKGVTATLVLSAPSGRNVTVPYTVGGTATPDSDHTAVDGTVQIPAGITTRSIHFAVVGDREPEPDETVVLTIGAVVNAVVGSGTHTTQVNDND